MAKSKLFRMFVAGTTISDGRTITPEMIDQVVETFDPATYTPRINVEHFKGFSPEPPFNGYGDVIHVEARDDEISIAGKIEKRRALYGQVEGNDQLVKLAKADQKPFPSVELTPAYAGTDKVGLIGLAFTDSPASIATQRLQFSRSAPGTLRAHDDAAVTLEFDEAPADSAGIAAAIVAGFGKVATMFSRTEPVVPKEEPKTPANDNFDPAAFATAMGEQLSTTFAELLKPVADAQAATARDLAALKTQLAGTEAPGFSRQPSPGGQGKLLADC